MIIRKAESCPLSLQPHKTPGQQKLVHFSSLFEGLYLLPRGTSAHMNWCNASNQSSSETHGTHQLTRTPFIHAIGLKLPGEN